MRQLRDEMRQYYDLYRDAFKGDYPAENQRIRQAILATMDAYVVAHPDCHPALLKARLHEEMAERFEPVIFPHSPFFYEMGLRVSENWGTPNASNMVVGSWNINRYVEEKHQRQEWKNLYAFQCYLGESPVRVWNVWDGFDTDHHSLGTTKLLRVGVNGILAEIAARQAQPCSAHQAANLEAMTRSCRAVLRVAERFGEAARRQLATERDPQAQRFLTMISNAAEHIPAEPPRTFYEGLAMLWFLREVTATLESIGVSNVGHIDRLLGGLYQDDLAAGRITEDEARDLLARWMLPTDIKFHVEDSVWPETSTCIELGGCDEDGVPVWNDVTRLFLEVHHAHHFLNPKLNCRYSVRSPQAYLDLISAQTLAGHNQFALLNDDVLIPACVRAGKTEREARRYVNGGCQETIVEGVEHSAGAYYYFNMARVLDLCLQPITTPLPADTPAEAAAAIPSPIPTVPDFETFYQEFMARLTATIRAGAGWVAALGHEHWIHHSCPFFSSTLEGCIDKGMDYTQGGAKYNPSGVSLVGLGTVVDSLSAIRTAVFAEQWLSLDELHAALAANWQGYEELRLRLQRLPKFDQGNEQVDQLAARFAQDLSADVNTIPSERGGTFQGSFFVYYAFQGLAPFVRATPDGRHVGDLLTQGIAPNRHTPPQSMTDIFHSLSRIDFCNYPGNAVLDTQLPLGQSVPPSTLSAVIRTFAQLGGPTLQPNCVSLDELRDAQLHPEQHRDLVVRISGLSAHFICLQKEVQDEIIGRAMMAV